VVGGGCDGESGVVQCPPIDVVSPKPIWSLSHGTIVL
jgi:hypothetical protein